MVRHRTITVAVLLGLAQSVPGEEASPYGARPDWCPPPHEAATMAAPEVVDGTHIDAGSFSARDDESLHFVDDVTLRQADQRLVTGELIYDPATGRVEFPGWLHYSDSLIRIEAMRAWYETQRERGRFDTVDFYIVGEDGSGSASTIEMVESGQAELESFDFTTCDPDRPDWQIRAERVHLDLDESVGRARNARLEFKGVPILYSPWLSFPLSDERKSGFLYPRLGYSGTDGFDVSVPWYWNIAPNQDATFTARGMSRRGAMLGTEYRFLTERHSGQIDLEFMPHDRIADRDRYFGQFEYRARLAPRWRGRVDFRRASDDGYFQDFGSDLVDSSIQFLRSSARLSGYGRHWSVEMLADDFQVLDDSVSKVREPYRRLPRMRFVVNRPLYSALEFDLDSELVYFDRDEGVTGARMDLHPSLGYNLIRPGWFVRPEVGVRTTAYELDGAEASSPSRTTPIASVDAGMVFERDAANGRLQTLEPRLFYLYVPYRNQDDIPEFDTRELTFGLSQLFHHNRFSGADRQADANQITLALTSRWLDAGDGRSLLDASIGQIFYFRDQRVQLPGTPETEFGQSATVAEMSWRPARAIALNAGLQWDSETTETRQAHFGLSYRDENARQVALGYRFRRDSIDQADVRFRYPLTRQLNLIGRLTWSFVDDEPLELLGGIEYESCCWALRLTGRDYVRHRDGERSTAVFVELQLRGLGSLGRPPYDLFRDRP